MHQHRALASMRAQLLFSSLFIRAPIAGKHGSGYNLQPNQSSSQRVFGASAFIWLGEFQKDGQMPIFFLLKRFKALEKFRAAV
jgi:hypothetical protein